MKSIFLITSILLAGTIACRAQQQDSLAVLQLFMKICNDYKQLPVQVDIDISHSTNYFVDVEDTSHVHGRFTLRREGSYIGLGEMEQIANDSIILLVSSRLKKMLLYSNHHSVSQQLQASMGWQLKDSSLKRLAAKYASWLKATPGDTAEIVITSRWFVRLTTLPGETIRVRYNPVNFQPYEIRQVKRSLRPVTEDGYRLLLQQPQVEKNSLVHSDSSHYVVREQVSVYRYDRITHVQDYRLPVTIDDRITKDGDGNYKPAGKYESYSLTRGF